jgi:hypothetical protein
MYGVSVPNALLIIGAAAVKNAVTSIPERVVPASNVHMTVSNAMV